MELRHLRYFVAVADLENVTRAAAKLHVAQPAISRQIRDLEEELGLSLLERTGRSVRLTDAGRIFLNEARAVLRRAQEAVEAVRAVGAGEGGELRVGYAPSLTAEILPRALRGFQSAFPAVHVSLHDFSTEEMLGGLREGRLDLALMVKPEGRQLRGLRFSEIANYPICLAVGRRHRLARQNAVLIENIVAEPLIVYTRASYPEYHTSLAKIFAPLGKHPPIAEEHDSVSSLIAAVDAGRGVALAPTCLACLAGPRLKLLRLKPSREQVAVGAVWRKENNSRIVEEFVDAAAGRAVARRPQRGTRNEPISSGLPP